MWGPVMGNDFDTSTGEGFRAARLHLGLSYRDLGEILGGIRADTIRKKWEKDAPSPGPMASRVLDWLLEGYRPPEWPAHLVEEREKIPEEDTIGANWRAQPCPCGDEFCSAWHVEPVAAVQGVTFTEAEAKIAAASGDLARALIAAEEHLSFCSYGDSYERECADTQNLPEKISEALGKAGL